MVIDERKTPWKKRLDRWTIGTGSVGVSGLNRVTEGPKHPVNNVGGSLAVRFDY